LTPVVKNVRPLNIEELKWNQQTQT
jgi:hypothetical protein